MDAQYRTPNLSPPPKHVRDRLWQIWLPVGAAGVIILAVMVYVVITAFAPGDDSLRKPADISLILLCLPGMMIGLVMLVLTAGMAYLTTMAIGKTPNLMFRVRDILFKITSALSKGADRATSPILAVEGRRAGFRRLRQILFSRARQ
ncbi:MAG TPA: hypothetical protein GYA06_09205 [Chloroflexi bacterium]|jgi:hypothetical protein|nr:hypothetical protein [Chloroflexota bacterium]